MIPILFPPNETEFRTQGLGALSDCISCTVTEERNGAFELEMEYPSCGIHFNEITDRCIIFAIPSPYRSPQPFRIYRITKPLNGVCTIYARHISYDLAGVPLNPFTANSAAAAMSGLEANAASASSFTFWTDKTTSAVFSVGVPSATRSVLGGQTGSVLDVYGGEYEWDKFTVKLYNQRGQDNGVTIRYGKNLTDIEQDRNISNVATGIYPYWTDTDGNLVVCKPKIITAPGTYDFVKIVPVDFSSDFEEQPTPEQLEARAKQYVNTNNIGIPAVSITASFIQLEQTEEYKHLALLEKCDLCDTVTVQFEKLGIDAKAKIVKTKTDVLKERYISVEIGDARTNIADTIISQGQEIQKRPTTTQVQQAVNNATEWITNGGGYIVAIKDENGSWKELVSLDKNNLQEAKNVWRWNNGGFGFSPNGYNGPYKVAITQDGHFVADFITTGTLVANIIKAGVLQSNDGETFFLDIENGVLKMKATEFSIGGKTIDQIAQEKADAAQQAASKELQDYANAVTGSLENLQGQIDGQIQTWFYDYVPTASNAPAAEWTTTEEKNKHLGDLFYIVNNATQGGQAYRWALVNGSYKWVLLEDAEVAKALASAAKAQDTADSKRRVFVTTPVPPYDVGDLWTQGASGDLMRCKTARQGGSYVSSDWEKATKYTDNTALTEFVNGTYKSTVEQLKQQADQKAETWYQSTDPSLNWSASEKPEHSGDIWYNTSTQQSYIYNGTAWQEMKTNPPEAVFDKIDGKAQVFVSQPVPPYSVGDLWTDSSTGDLRRCKTSRTSGAFNASDWILATDYVTSSDAADIANGAVSAQTQIDIFNKLTNNGALQGLYMQDGKLYINAEYLATGIIKKGNSFWDLTTGNLQMQGNFRTVSGGLTADLWGGVFKMLVDDKEVVGVSSIAGTNRGVVNVSENGVVKTAINGGDFYTGSIQASKGISAGGSVTSGGSVTANGDITTQANMQGKAIQATGSITAGQAIRFNAVRPNDSQNTLYTSWKRGTKLTSNDWVLVGSTIAPYSAEEE